MILPWIASAASFSSVHCPLTHVTAHLVWVESEIKARVASGSKPRPSPGHRRSAVFRAQDSSFHVTAATRACCTSTMSECLSSWSIQRSSLITLPSHHGIRLSSPHTVMLWPCTACLTAPSTVQAASAASTCSAALLHRLKTGAAGCSRDGAVHWHHWLVSCGM